MHQKKITLNYYQYSIIYWELICYSVIRHIVFFIIYLFFNEKNIIRILTSFNDQTSTKKKLNGVFFLCF